MDRASFSRIEAHMLECMQDSAHDSEHVYRVLYFAMDIARYEIAVDMDVLIAACLLHDIGRAAQYANPALGHAQVGSEMAYEFLLGIGWPELRAAQVCDCVASHRFRGKLQPESIEAKTLFDADKLDAAGTLGIARTLLYQGIVSQPLYTLDAQGEIESGTADSLPSFFREYKYKLETLYDRFYTQRARQLADEHRHAAAAFYENLLSEARGCYQMGKQALNDALNAGEA